MSYTNSTPNYNLPQWIGTDKPTFLGDFNSAFSEIDTQMKANADASTAATATANAAAATATSANTNATTALNTANSAASEAASATSAAASATSTANTASANADAALRASAANTIENLAPAYDPTLTYSVGDLVTYIDDQNSGKLYKCIVAVTSPMDFNINYWDDVTTSEVYATKSSLVATVTCDGTQSYGDTLNALYAQHTFSSDKEYLYEMVIGTSHYLAHEQEFATTGIVFTNVSLATSGGNYVGHDINEFWLKDSDSKCYKCEITTSGTSVTDRTSSLVSTRTINVYELMTT